MKEALFPKVSSLVSKIKGDLSSSDIEGFFYVLFREYELYGGRRFE